MTLGVVVRVPRWLWWSALLCFVGLRYHHPIRHFLGGFRCAVCGLAKDTAAELLGERRRDGYVSQIRALRGLDKL